MKRLTLTSGFSLSLLAALSTALMYFFSTGLEGFRPLVWIAPIPVLVMAMRSSRRSASVMAFCAYLLGGLNLASYLSRLAPAGVVVASAVIPAFAFMLVVVACRDAIIHLRRPMAFIAFPVGWTAYEYLLSIFSPHGSAGSIAYTQSDFLLLVQIASLTGMAGITFVLTLVPAAIAVALHSRTKGGFVLPLLVAVVVFLGTMAFGWVRLSDTSTREPIRVGLVAIDSTVRYINTTERERALSVTNRYDQLGSKLAGQGARILVFPEKLAGMSDLYEEDVFKNLGDLAQREKLYIVAGLNRLGTEPHRNLAVVFSPDGTLLAKYDKVFPIPGLESEYLKGDKPLFLNIAELSAGIAICKDLDFARWMRQYGAEGVGIMFVPAWDFTADGWLHSRMAIMRGVENGFAIVRAANNGSLTASDDKGRIVGEAVSSRSAAITLLSDVRPGSGHTLYAVAGDWFSWLDLLCLLALLGIVSQRLARRHMKGNESAMNPTERPSHAS